MLSFPPHPRGGSGGIFVPTEFDYKMMEGECRPRSITSAKPYRQTIGNSGTQSQVRRGLIPHARPVARQNSGNAATQNQRLWSFLRAPARAQPRSGGSCGKEEEQGSGTQFSPQGGNGVERTLLRRALCSFGYRTPFASE